MVCSLVLAACSRNNYNPAGKLAQLSWSSNSELLAVVLVNATSDNEEAGEGIVQIWHRSNWHWYLKQEQVYPEAQGLQVCWDEVAALRLHVSSGAGWYRQVCAPHELTVCYDYVSCTPLAVLYVYLLVFMLLSR